MAARKKTTAKSTGKSKKKTVKKTLATTSPKKLSTLTVKDPLTKGGIIKAMTDITTLSKKDVVASLDALTAVLLKINVVKKAAKPARKGINPFTGEEVMFKAKPAHKVIKIKALKKLKEMTD
jgi:nucleoid DNA-binding protein